MKTASIILACLFFIGCAEKQDDPVLIQMGDYRVTRAAFQKALDRLTAEGMEGTEEERAKVVLDDLINAGLLANLARQNGYSSDRDYQREMQYYTSGLYSKYGKLARCGLQGLPAEIDKRREHSGGRMTATIDYIYIPASQKAIYKEIRERMDAGANTADLIKTSKFEEWNQRHLRFYSDVRSSTALLPEKVLEKLPAMTPGQIGYFEDGPGKYIIKVTKQLLEPAGEGADGAHFLQLKMAECVKKGDSLMDPYDLDRRIQINHDLFDMADLFILPVTEPMEPGNADPVVVEFEGKKIHETQLRGEISSLPVSIQTLFRNKQSRIWLITNYILHRYADLAEARQLAERADQALLRQSLYRRLREDKVTDTVSWLMEMIRKKQLKSVSATLPVKELQEAGKEQDYSWLFNDRQPGRENLRLNFPVIRHMNFGGETNIGDDEILAAGGQWKLRVGDLKMKLGQMSPESRMQLYRSDIAVKAIYYIAHEQGGPENNMAIRINYNLMNRVDMVGGSFDSLVNFPPDVAIATLENTRLTEDRIRQIVARMPGNERFEFLLETNSRNEALKRMLVDQYWQDQADPHTLPDNPQFREEKLNYENWLLARIYYQKTFYIEPAELDDEFLDRDIRKACKMLSEEWLKDALSRAATQACITVNTDVLRKLGGDLSKSTYSGLINKNCH